MSAAERDLGQLLTDLTLGLVGTDPDSIERVIRPAVLAHARRLTAAWEYLAVLLDGHGEVDRAGVEAERALGLWDAANASGAPGIPPPEEIEAIVLLLTGDGRGAEAVPLARAAIDLDPADPRPFAALGLALAKVEDFAASERAFIRSSDLWGRVGAFDRQLMDAQIAAGLEGAGPAAGVAVAVAEARKGDVAGARSTYDAVVAEAPEARSAAVEAELVLRGGGSAEALELADAILAADRGDVEAAGVRAEALRQLGRPAEAIEELGRVVEAGGGDRFRIVIASMLALSGGDADALPYLEQLGRLARAVPLVMLIRAEIHLHLEQYDESTEWFDRFLRADPGNPNAVGERAQAQFQQNGDIESALAVIDGLLAQPPTDPDVAAWCARQDPATIASLPGQLSLIRGQLRRAMNRHEDAVADFRAAAEALGWRPDVVEGLAFSLVSSGRPEEALQVIDEAPPVTSSMPGVLTSKSLALLHLGRHAEALEAIDGALAVSPGSVVLQRYRDLVLVALGRGDEALSGLQELVSLTPGDPDTLVAFAVALQSQGRNEEAIEAFRRAETAGGGPDVFEQHVDLLVEMDRGDDALRVAGAAAERFPDHPKALRLHASALARQEDFEGAVRLLERCIELEPDQPTVAADIGEYLRRLGGRDEEALQWLDRAVAGDSASVFALGTRGQVLLSLGRRDEGIRQLREADRAAGGVAPAWVVQELTAALGAEGTPAAFREALEQIDRYLSSRPRDAWGLATRADLLRLLDRPAEGLEVADQALAVIRDEGGDETGVLGTKAQLLVDLTRGAEALEIADGILDASGGDDSPNTFARGARIRALASLNRHAEALEELDRYVAVALDAGDSWPRVMRASLLTDYRNYEEAAAILEDLPADDPQTEALRGLCRNRLGDHRDALPPLERAVEAYPQLWWCWAELALARLDVDDTDGAKQALQALVDGASSSTAADAILLGNAAWATFMLGDAEGAVSLAQWALSVDNSNPGIRQVLGTALILAGRSVAGLDEIEAAAEAATGMPDPVRAAAILEDGVEDLERLGRDGRVDVSSGDAALALDALKTTAERLRHAMPAAAGTGVVPR